MKFLLSKQFWISIILLLVTSTIIGFVSNKYILPVYTNFNQGLTVPDVTKMPYDEAITLLNSIGLRDSIIDKRYNSAFPANYVIDQTPSASIIVKPNRKVYLTVNTSSTPKVIVPNVTDLSLRNAELQLQNYGLRLGTVSYISSPYKNTVISQSIEVGTPVEKGTVISLVISDGLGVKKVKLPELNGLRLFEAQAKLRTLGLRIGEILFKPIEDGEANLILDFSPKSDSLIEGAKINLVVSEQKNTQEAIEQGVVNNDTTSVDKQNNDQQ